MTADPHLCDSAREYVLDRLAESTDPLAPAELAEEYGCVKDHMRNVMSELYEAGKADRVARGSYVLSENSGEDSEYEQQWATLQGDDDPPDEAASLDPPEESGEGDGDGAEDLTGSDDQPVGIPFPVSGLQFVGIVVVLIGIVVFLRWRQSGSGPDRADRDGIEEENEQPEGGLV